ncbi:uncharacterized protein SPSK_08147 [Sporothrix schenckii 1099-18]|uniref:Uncharacterized protein n=1 Tax=Sporothrix schenckii 1099-18 TaxID=1397361 RepID=A0A0F2MJN2_SPOSC|nr:uncharacterized protein SPSK_08147 [Sporothrix schenckii 1099-18]KJR88396.1 hypothetical protein SPSK_08147 [Sporothrix schenckii 1099-18]
MWESDVSTNPVNSWLGLVLVGVGFEPLVFTDYFTSLSEGDVLPPQGKNKAHVERSAPASRCRFLRSDETPWARVSCSHSPYFTDELFAYSESGGVQIRPFEFCEEGRNTFSFH